MIILMKKINLSDEFISHIYELLFNDLKEKDKDKKLSKDKFIGFMKLLITAITSDQSVKNTVISKKLMMKAYLKSYTQRFCQRMTIQKK